jgi:lysophospholipase L1-like esterase
LSAVLPATKFEWRRALGDRSDMIVDLNTRLKFYADANKIPFVDYHSAMKNDKNGMNPDLAEDGVHPTLKGYKIMEGLVEQAVAKALKQK